jgi:hypothetical protein
VAASYESEAGARARLTVDARTLWAGGLASAAVAALAYAVGVVIVRGVFDIAMLAPTAEGVLGDASTWQFALAAFVAALLATALMHLLLVATPRPYAFFGWIVGLVVTLVAVLPFTQEAALSAKLATAIVNLVVGLVIASLVAGTARRALRPARTAGSAGRQPGSGPPPAGPASPDPTTPYGDRSY